MSLNTILHILVVLSLRIVNVLGQNNVNTVLSSFLRDCYSDPWLVNRNNLPIMTIPVMLDIVRKIEDHPNTLGDMRQISTGISHLFRQDGIVYDPIAVTENIVPYSPTGFQTYKNRLLLTKLLPNNQFTLPINSVTQEEKCALHHMVSSSTYLHSRGDEEYTCDQLTVNNQMARLTRYDKSQDVEIFDVNGVKDIRGQQIMGISKCPIETGVVSSKWGDIAMGTVIAGVAAGMEEQNVLVSDLVSVKSSFSDSNAVVNNRYASTLAGDIAEVAIRQGTSRNALTVGVVGGWNSTHAKRHYFLTRNTDLEITDAEIRAGLDGLVLSELAPAYVKTFSELKLSQILDMYYTDNGILHEKRFRACNRKVLVPEIASTQMLIEQSLGPAIALYHFSSLTATTNIRGIQTFVNNTVSAFHSYIPQVQDLVCNITNNQVIRPKVNLILVTEPTVARSQVISNIINEIDVGKFGSSITLVNSNNGEIVVEKTFSPARFYQEFAKRIVAQTGAVNILAVLTALKSIVINETEAEHSQHYCGGNSTVALILSDLIPLSGRERIKAVETSRFLQDWIPDFRLVFAASSASQSAVQPMLRFPSDFIPITLSDLSTRDAQLETLTQTLITMPRRIMNPLCGIQFTNQDSGTIGFEDYVDADGINLYKVMPNYYYESSLSTLVCIESTDYGSLSVCYSRTNTFPRRNRTSNTVPGDVVCSSAASSGIVEINLGGACDGYSSVRDCPPLYVTVSSTAVPITPQCKDFSCRYPNDVKYVVVAQELGCFGYAATNTSNKILLIVLLIASSFNKIYR